MAKAETTQLNIRSRFARQRAVRIARETGMTLTQVIEEALRAYQPTRKASGGGSLAMKSGILVRPKTGRTVSSGDVDAAFGAIRDARG